MIGKVDSAEIGQSAEKWTIKRLEAANILNGAAGDGELKQRKSDFLSRRLPMNFDRSNDRVPNERGYVGWEVK